MTKSSWIDNAITALRQTTDKNDRIRKRLIAFLESDLEEILHLEKLFMVEGIHLAYPFLQNEINNLALGQKRHASAIRRLIGELDDSSEKTAEKDFDVMPRGNFKEIFEIESELDYALTDHMNFAENYGYEDVAKKLHCIRNERDILTEQLERIIMRINAEI